MYSFTGFALLKSTKISEMKIFDTLRFDQRNSTWINGERLLYPQVRMCALSIDLESWVHRQTSCTLDSKYKKELDQGYIERATLNLLSLLNKYNRKVTFFVVSEIFDWYPDVIQRIKEHGHEIAYHTHTHRRIKTKQELVEEIRKSKNFIQEFEPIGFRAPEAKIRAEYLEILAKYGFKYDSSSYGTLDTSTKIHGIREIPISTFRFWFLNSSGDLNFQQSAIKKMLFGELPLGSGFFMSTLDPIARILPSLLSFHNKVPVLFVHPWQIITYKIFLPTYKNTMFKRIELSLYSRKCLGSFVYLLRYFQTILMKDLAYKLEIGEI